MPSPRQLITSFPSILAIVVFACLCVVSGAVVGAALAFLSVVALHTIATRAAALSPLPARVDDRPYRQPDPSHR